MNACAWLKTFKVASVISGFTQPLNLPRIDVNLASVQDTATRERLRLMSRKLHRFTTGLGLLAVGLGLLLWGGDGVGRNAGGMQAELIFVLGLVLYHAYCANPNQRFAGDGNTHSHVWCRWFHEIPALMPVAIFALAIGQPL
jgi:protoporphyrinogen IX oxidase